MIFSPVNEWRVIAFASPHKITSVGYVKNIYLQPPVVDPSFEDFRMKKNFAFSLKSFRLLVLPVNLDLESHDSGFHVYF